MSPTPRLRRPWLAWGVLTSGSITVAIALAALATGWPAVWIGALSAVPVGALATGLGRTARPARLGASVLAATVVTVGVVALVVGLFLLVVLVLGRRPAGGERIVFLLCFVASLVACALLVPMRRRLERWARRVVLDDDASPERALASLEGRLTRALPLDEILLQVVESIHRTMAVTSAELWTGENGRLELAASIPDREAAPVQFEVAVDRVVARAGAQGNAWLGVWIPELLDGRDRRQIRTVPIQHRGDLLGLLLLERADDAEPFDDRDDRLVLDVARQLGLALHNARLDAALRASVRDLEQSNAELTASRARLVSAADETRRHIERDLHDGSQQRLVGLAMQIGIAQRMLADDPERANALLAQLAADVDGAIVELRELAHGIYPPRLRDRGLGEAIRVAAQRTGLRTTVEIDGVGRYPRDIEAAVYFCCSEAILNATKYAGEDATISITVTATREGLEFTVADDGRGFDPRRDAAGQGLTNMRDRIGAAGGELTIESAAGCGTVVRGVLPAVPVETATSVSAPAEVPSAVVGVSRPARPGTSAPP